MSEQKIYPGGFGGRGRGRGRGGYGGFSDRGGFSGRGRGGYSGGSNHREGDWVCERYVLSSFSSSFFLANKSNVP
jgi:hypothetical protein